VFEPTSAALFASNIPLHPSASRAGRGNIYVVINLGKRTAAKLGKGTAESPNMDAVEIPKVV
jgi:hypothetical protein